MMLDLRDDSSGPVLVGSLILEAAIADQWSVARSAAWPDE